VEYSKGRFMDKFFRLLVIFSILCIPFAGCGGTEKATDEEAMKGMDDKSTFRDVSDDEAP